MNEDDKQQNDELAARLISEQNFLAAVIAGALATVLAAAAYGITVATWRFSYGFVASAVGIFIGLSIRFLGRGITTKFAALAAAYAIAGCLLGRLIRVIVNLAVSSSTSPLDIVRRESLPVLAERSAAYFSLLDLVYWFVAVFFAAYLARRPLSRSERLAVGLYQARPASTRTGTTPW